MSEDQSHESVEREHVQRSEHAQPANANGPGLVGEFTPLEASPYAGNLLGSSKLDGRDRAKGLRAKIDQAAVSVMNTITAPAK